jgi:hypothetical protein
MVRVKGSEGKMAGPAADVSGPLLAKHPALAEWLTAVAWDDGKPRQVGTLMVLAEGGLWKAWLHDRAQARACWLAAERLDALFAAIEETVASGRGDWRPDKKRM